MRIWQIPILPVVLLAFGCDGVVGLHGWVVESAPGTAQVIVFPQGTDAPANPPGKPVSGAWVELWRPNGKRLMSRSDVGDGRFSVGYIGPYSPGLKYLIKAGAPGYVTIKRTVQLEWFGNSGTVELPPLPPELLREQ